MPVRRPTSQVIDLGDGFFNIRGSFKIAKVVDIGTQASLVRLGSGKFVMLDACTLDDDTARFIDEMTEGGKLLEAFLHVHPFHTIFAKKLHERYPEAKLYGTRRHAEKLPDLPWEPEATEEEELSARYSDDLELSVPEGVAFVTDDPDVHFSSVLVFHPASKTLHVDDTISYTRFPKLMRALKRDTTFFHPTLAKVLEPRAGAAEDFRRWARGIVERAREVENLCAAHTAALIGDANDGDPVADRIAHALEKVEPKLVAHAKRHG